MLYLPSLVLLKKFLNLIHNQNSLPPLFKGIALFTPGGDLIYGIDSSKQAHWHSHLCLGLQNVLGLLEAPLFLVPGYTATVDRWMEVKTQQIRTSAEMYPAIQRYQPLLQVLFETGDIVWQTVPWQEEYCHPMILETYRHQFPQLWENHNLIIRFDPNSNERSSSLPESSVKEHSLPLGQKQNRIDNNVIYADTEEKLLQPTIEDNNAILRVPIYAQTNQETKTFAESSEATNNGYILRLFVSSDNAAVEKTLTKIHRLLEEGLVYPYTLKVIDISQHPEQAENYHVAATPTLVRVWPQPIRRIVGKLDDFERVLQIITSF